MNEIEANIVSEEERVQMFKAVMSSGISSRRNSKKMEEDVSRNKTIKHYFVKNRRAFNN